MRAGLPGGVHSRRPEKRREQRNAVGEIPSASDSDFDCYGASGLKIGLRECAAVSFKRFLIRQLPGKGLGFNIATGLALLN